MRLLHELDDLRQCGVFADLCRFKFERAFFIDRAADDVCTGLLSDGQRLARNHALVHRATPFDDDAIGRHALAGLDEDHIADHDLLDRHLDLAVCFEHARHLWCQIHERLNRRAGAPLRACLQIFADADERDDHRRCLKVNMPFKHIRRDKDRIQKRHTAAERDQHVHRCHAIFNGFPRMHKKWLSRVEHDWQRIPQQQQIDAVILGRHLMPHHPRAHRRVRLAKQRLQNAKVAAHANHKRRQRKNQPNDEAPFAVGDLGVARSLLDIRVICCGILRGDCDVVAGFAHCADHVIEANGARHKVNTRALTCVIDRHICHTELFFECALNRVSAVGTGHAKQRQLRMCQRHIVARLAHAFDQFCRLDLCRVKLHLSALTRVVDISLTHARRFLQRARDRIGTVGAGHAGDR